MNIAQRPSASLSGFDESPGQVDQKAAAKALLRSIVALQSSRTIFVFLFLSIVLSFLASVLLAISPVLFSKAVDALSSESTVTSGALIFVLLSLIALGISKFLTEQRWLIYQPAENRILNSVRETYLQHLLNLPVSFHVNRSMGRLDSIVGQGLAGIQTLSGMVFTQLSPLIFEILITSAAVFTFVDADISAIILATIVFYVLTLVIGAEWASRRLKMALNVSIEAQGAAGDAILNAEGIKTLVIEDEIVRSYRERLHDVHLRFRKFYFSRGFLGITLSAVLLCGFAAALWLSATRAVLGELSVGALVLTNTYILQLFRTMEGFSFSYRDTRQSFESVKRFLEVFAEDRDADQRSLGPVDALSAIDIDKVSYKYPDGRWALRNASLRVEKGKITALLGKSGSGKSTLVRLVLKSLPLSEGNIRANGVDINELNGLELRRKIAVVPQDAVMFRESLGFNISLSSNPDQRKMEAAVRAAEIADLVLGLPDGYDTEIGERGFKLSGGERQRLAIARAIYRDADILIFDEATSALDERTKAEILNLIRSLSVSRGILLITHDQAVAAIADTIVALDREKDQNSLPT
ncbi:ABC transporter ATP-binding protein [Agrobacterium genomosp. 2 str. CFBP 5494]|nr:ABC transporter family protein [Brucella lupini]CAD7030318.1 ABC transporter ATP-binding protein [Rhizobium sp. P007]CUX03856.1 ABC transporter ATP-binding protein [Agrobacterium genomosp. 2 str. CFBP 5494]CZT37893.1 ATP-binding cassette, subfamily B [Rhizobium sp. 9140]